jgi:uncharacterized protein (TIRG00374 family)
VSALIAPEARAAAPDAPVRRRRLGPVRHVAGVVLALALVLGVLPRVGGVDWRQIAVSAGGVSPGVLAGLAALWAAGLLAHTITLTAALPGLSHRRALLLSLTGSAVANVLPVGGAAGVALNVRMARAWRFSPIAIGAYTVVTNVWDVLAKFALPLAALPLLVITGSGGASHLTAATVAVVAVAAVGAVVLPATAALLTSSTTTDRAGRAGDRLLGRWLRSRSLHSGLMQLHHASRPIVRDRWRPLSLGMAVYTALLFLLLLACLTATGADMGVGAVLVGFTVERLLTLAGLTPGGTGVVEVGLTTALLAFPGSAVGVTAGVLLYRLLTYGLEIPVGGAALVGWLWHRRAQAAR